MIPFALISARQWRAIVSASVVAAALMAGSLVAFGLETLPAFFGRVVDISTWMASHERTLWKTPTIFALARLIDLPISWSYFAQFVAAVPVVAAVIWVWRNCQMHELRSAVLVAGALITTPYLLDYDLVWLALPIAWFSSHAKLHGWRRGEAFWISAAWILPLFIVVLQSFLKLPVGQFVLVALFIVTVRRALFEVNSARAAISAAQSSVMISSSGSH